MLFFSHPYKIDGELSWLDCSHHLKNNSIYTISRLNALKFYSTNLSFVKCMRGGGGGGGGREKGYAPLMVYSVCMYSLPLSPEKELCDNYYKTLYS